WTDEQIARAIREGVRPDGSLIGPPMPFQLYRKISDRDVEAIVAYLRTVAPVRHEVPPSQYEIALPRSYGPPVDHVPEVSRKSKIAYGGYLAGPLGHCIECHTPMGASGQRDWSKLGGGGAEFHGPWGTSVAPNITSDPKAGIGSWTDAQIKRAITEGISADGRKLMA